MRAVPAVVVTTVTLLTITLAGCTNSGRASAPELDVDSGEGLTSHTSRPDHWPDKSNTGVRTTEKLVPVEDLTVKQDGAVIENMEITGELNIAANDVVVRNVRLTQHGDWGVIQREEYSGAVIEDSEIVGDGKATLESGVLNQGGMITVRRVDFHGMSNAIQSDQGLFTGNYIHDFREFPGDHVVGIASNGAPREGMKMIIKGNTILNQIGQTSAISLYQDFSRSHDKTIEGNLLAGGGYTVYGGSGKYGKAENIRIIGNVFSRKFFPKGGYYGPLTAFDPKGSGNVWEGNVWEDTGGALKP